MQFKAKEWSKIYNTVHELGQRVKDSQVDWEGNPPINPLPRDTQVKLESEIKTLCQRSNHYLDQCGMRMPKPLWYYDRKDPRTWKSHESFKFAHLIED